MTLEPLLAAGAPIPSHAIAAIACVVLGAAQLWLIKGTRRHQIMGWLWVGLMGYVAASSFFINHIKLLGPFSPIHLLSVVTLLLLAVSLNALRRGKTRTHGTHMRFIFISGCLIAGAFTFLPGRVMHQVLTREVMP